MIILPGVNGREISKDYNEIYAHEGTTMRRAKLEMFIAKRLGEKLVAAYPNRQWGVEVDIDGGVVIVKCPSVSQTKGYHLHLGKRNMHELGQAAVRAAGEILERHNVSRSRYFQDFEIFDHLPQTLRGDVITPDAAPEPIKKRVA